MNIWGKVICGVLGWLLTGANPFGLILGVWIGHSFDKAMSKNFSAGSAGFSGFGSFNHDPARTQQVFFDATFQVMGHLAKADGVVTQQEIQVAESVMVRMGIVGARRQQAIDAFSVGKSSDFDLDNCLQELVIHCARQPSLIQMFLEIQLLAATADGHASEPEMNVLYQIGQRFGLPRQQIERLLQMVMAQQSFHGGSAANNSGRPTLSKAFQVIGVSEEASKAEVKRAYRKLMSQHHPDKLVAKGMPEDMIKVATEKSQEIQAAWDMIKKTKQW